MIDFERTYRARRTICLALQHSQKSESEIVEQSRQIAVNAKREMLLLLSKWLLDLNSASTLSEAERKEIQRLTQISLETWTQLQKIAVQNETELKASEVKVKDARATLDKKTPFGTATKVFADAESKTQIKALQNNLALAQKQREGISESLKKNIIERQKLAEIFFRDCLRQWDKLALTQVLGKDSGAILNRMTQETNTIWVKHLRQQTEELDQVAKQVENLRESYKNIPATLTQQYIMPSPQEHSNEYLQQGNSYDFTK